MSTRENLTREAIIKLAREAGFEFRDRAESRLERFAALVAAAEREACAKVCEEYDACDPKYIAMNIRARK
jgi:uncharacterized membrane protein